MQKFIVCVQWYDNDYYGKIELVDICNNISEAKLIFTKTENDIFERGFDEEEYVIVIEPIEIITTPTRIFYDSDYYRFITIEKLKEEYEYLKSNGEIETSSFNEYIKNCMYYNNGTLQELIGGRCK